jgi:hypothetical protein
MTQQNLLQLAKQGNPKAIATMLNQSLKSKSITAKASLKDGYLQILLESAQTPNQQDIVSFIRKGLTNLSAESITRVKVYGRQIGEESPAWSQAFEMVSELETPSNTEQLDVQDLPPPETVYETPEPVSLEVETPLSTRKTDRQNLRRNPATSHNPSPHQPMGPLSVGNVVSTGLVLYRSHLKSYFAIALIATLWMLLPFLLIIPIVALFFNQVLQVSTSTLGLIIPIWLALFIYCFANYLTNSALISRLGFGELVSKPESAKAARSHVNPRPWSFLLLTFLVGILMLLFYFLLAIPIGIVNFALVFALSTLVPGVGVVVGIVFSVLAILFGLSWLYSRLLVAEVVLAAEDGKKTTESISRSWKLTQNSVWRIQGVVLLAFVVTLPIVFLSAYLPQILLFYVEQGSMAYGILYSISLILSFAAGALLMPFWQTLKAVVYYDLRSRREGLGLQLRDSRSL